MYRLLFFLSFAFHIVCFSNWYKWLFKRPLLFIKCDLIWNH